MEQQFKYDAFISYRHSESDKFVAENLHKQLESFRLPAAIAKKRPGEKTKIERVFRDKEELPLTSNLEDPIVDALNNSEWLIVICSPRLRESLWCKKEIETFVALRGRERVLAVLIEGEPSESFPDELLYETKKQTLPDGTVEEVKVPVEPLAADVRGKTKKEMLKAMKTEILRLLAAMFQLSYDDLRQRHKERRMRRIVTASLIGGAACLLFGVYSTATAIRINSQKQQIEAQSLEIQQQNEELALKQAHSLTELSEQYLEAGDRKNAIKFATEALTESGGVKLPYTPNAQYALVESLRVYDTGDEYKSESQYETAGRIESLVESPDSDTLAIYDNTQTLTLFDVEKQEVIHAFNSTEYNLSGIYGTTFLGENYFAYVNPEDKVCIYDLEQKKVIKELAPEYASNLISDEKGRYLAVNQWGNSYAVYDGTTFEELGMTPEFESDHLVSRFSIHEDVFACEFSKDDENGNTTYYLGFVDLNTMQMISIYDMGAKELKELTIRDGIAYVASGCYGEYYSDCDAYISAVNITNGTLLWENEQKGFWTNMVRLPECDNAKELLFVTNGSLSLINMKTGAVSALMNLESPVVEANVFTDSAYFLLFCESGELLLVSEEQGQKLDMSHKFECKTFKNDEILHSQYGISVLQHNDNKITFYTNTMGPDVIETEQIYDLPEETESIIGDDAVEIATSYGLDKPEYVLNLYYNEDKTYCFILYWDHSFVVYDVKNSVVCSTIDNVYPTKWCLGTDTEGYTYIVGFYGCYVLNRDMQPVMWLPQANYVDTDNQMVYIHSNSGYYQAPLYNLEQLLQMAENYNAE
ncbi:MAG: toll/interleukin-1 receptor domain-containing protein [Lachnospiraceae bacterium]|nr:toll/interleukin-1 receptor domain-containing protein [Lachnospiraceae bacterium]